MSGHASRVPYGNLGAIMKCFILAIAGLVAVVAVVTAQWGSGGCSAQVSVDTVEWRELPGDPERIYLYRNGRQVGGWDYGANVWRDYDAERDVWSPPIAQPPVAPPNRIVHNFGVDSAKLQ